MAQTIWKTPLESDGLVNLPLGAEVLSVQMQDESPTIWTLVDPAAEKVPTRLGVYGTGHPIPDNPGRFIGTFQMEGGALVFHLFQPAE